MVPAWHNADSIGYNPKATNRPIESWGELLNKDWKGKVALLNVPSSITQCAIHRHDLAIEALGLKKFGDKGDMTKPKLTFSSIISSHSRNQVTSAHSGRTSVSP
jgi:hypothetical protein